MDNLLKEALNRIRDLLVNDDGQAHKEARKFIERVEDLPESTDDLTKQLEDMTSMYQAQCSATDRFAELLENEKERKGDVRIAELESQLEIINKKLAEANEQIMKLTKV